MLFLDEEYWGTGGRTDVRRTEPMFANPILSQEEISMQCMLLGRRRFGSAASDGTSAISKSSEAADGNLNPESSNSKPVKPKPSPLAPLPTILATTKMEPDATKLVSEIDTKTFADERTSLATVESVVFTQLKERGEKEERGSVNANSQEEPRANSKEASISSGKRDSKGQGSGTSSSSATSSPRSGSHESSTNQNDNQPKAADAEASPPSAPESGPKTEETPPTPSKEKQVAPAPPSPASTTGSDEGPVKYERSYPPGEIRKGVDRSGETLLGRDEADIIMMGSGSSSGVPLPFCLLPLRAYYDPEPESYQAVRETYGSVHKLDEGEVVFVDKGGKYQCPVHGPVEDQNGRAKDASEDTTASNGSTADRIVPVRQNALRTIECRTCETAWRHMIYNEVDSDRGEHNYRGNPSILIRFPGKDEYVEKQITTTDKSTGKTTISTKRILSKRAPRRHILIDCGKTFNQNALRYFPYYGVPTLDAVIITHDHADALMGLDDLRGVQKTSPPKPGQAFRTTSAPIEIYSNPRTHARMKAIFPYLFPREVKVGVIRRKNDLEILDSLSLSLPTHSTLNFINYST